MALIGIYNVYLVSFLRFITDLILNTFFEIFILLLTLELLASAKVILEKVLPLKIFSLKVIVIV